MYLQVFRIIFDLKLQNMAQAILLPKQGQSVETCIITEFYVSVGDEVSVGTPLFAYETDKASFEEESSVEGKILALFYEEGDEVPVLTNIGVIGKEGESIDSFLQSKVDQKSMNANKQQEEEVLKEKTTASADMNTRSKQDENDQQNDSYRKESTSRQNRIFITPRARNLAKMEGINIEHIKGSGPNGRILEADVRKEMKAVQESIVFHKKESSGKVSSGSVASGMHPFPDAEIEPLSNIRKLIAKAMHNSLQHSAQLTHHLSADARKIIEHRQNVKDAQKEGYAHNITLNDMICAALIQALIEFPRANAHFLGDSMKIFNKVHLGLAVDTDRGLMVPAIRNADDLSIEGLSSQMKNAADACRSGNIDPDLLLPEAASFTVSNLGNYGVEMFTPVVNLPQVAILGVNTILPRPKDLGNGMYGFVPHLGLSLTYDHQALDGGEATRFLKTIANAVENFELKI